MKHSANSFIRADIMVLKLAQLVKYKPQKTRFDLRQVRVQNTSMSV